METPHVLEIVNRTAVRMLEVAWSNGETHQVPHRYLRAKCRCAHCLKLATSSVSSVTTDDIAEFHLREIRTVGAYGLQLIFADGHDRGIYPWSYLYGLSHELQAKNSWLNT